MLVYVISCHDKPLMPCSARKARLLLKRGLAKVIRREPFTIRLLFGSSGYKQPVITYLLSTRRELRTARRNRKTRYRKPRFLNRIKAKEKDRLAPTILNRINAHLKVVDNVFKILPITKIIVETASFDIQKLKNPDISGVEYQQGEQLNFWNVREYVLFRDNHICQHCHGKSKDAIFKLKQTRGQSFKAETFMGISRWAFFNKLKEIYPVEVRNTFGYLTKNTRIKAGLPKAHHVDAFCIAGNMQAERLSYHRYQKQVRKHNRQIHKLTINKGGRLKRNQSPFEVFGFRLFDKVAFKGEVGFIFGRRASGSFDVRKLDGTKISAGISYKKLMLISKRKTYLTERRGAASSPCLNAGISAAHV